MNLIEHVPAPHNDPKLFEPVTVRVLRAFCVKGTRCEAASIVCIERSLALSLQAIGKCELIDHVAGGAAAMGKPPVEKP